MKKHKRLDRCLNCGTPTGENINFCPQCGQENVNKRQPFWSILIDAITGFFSIDSKTFRSIVPLLFKPGFLTKEYMAGRLVSYVHPARMFITITILYFILSSLLSTGDQNGFKINIPEDDAAVKDTDQVNINFGNTTIDYTHLSELMQKGIHDPEQMADSLGLKKTFWNMLVIRQAMKTKAMSREAFISYYKSRLPWIMFAIMPVFALIMKLVYLKRKRYYIDHLVFAYHFHSFVFMLMLAGLLVRKVWSGLPEWPFVLWIVIYLLLAMMRVYDDTLPKALLRSVLISIVYLIAGIAAFVLSLLVLFFLF